MKYASFIRAVPALALAAAALSSAPAAASPYTSMVVFGDSLSDSGNNALAIGAQSQTISGNSYIPTFPYITPSFSGTYSNGPVWASYAASGLGVPLLPSLAGGTNYAFGGATTGPAVSAFPYSLLTQANQYLSSTSGKASANALYVVEGGGNDARAALAAIALNPGSAASVIQATATAFAANVGTIVNELAADGAKHIIVWDAPNLGLAPAVATAGASALGSLLAGDMNMALAAALAGDAGVKTFDIYGLGTSISNDPAAYGFTNTTDACGAVAGANCNTYTYWDGIHPTTAADMVIARAFLAEAAPEPSTWFMMIVGFAAVGFTALRRKPGPAPVAA